MTYFGAMKICVKCLIWENFSIFGFFLILLIHSKNKFQKSKKLKVEMILKNEENHFIFKS